MGWMPFRRQFKVNLRDSRHQEPFQGKQGGDGKSLLTAIFPRVGIWYLPIIGRQCVVNFGHASLYFQVDLKCPISILSQKENPKQGYGIPNDHLTQLQKIEGSQGPQSLITPMVWKRCNYFNIFCNQVVFFVPFGLVGHFKFDGFSPNLK